MLHYPDLRSVRTGWVDLDKVGPKVWLKLRYERWVRHYDHVFVKSHAGVDFQAARLCEAAPTTPKNNFCVIQLLSSFRI